MAAGTVLGMRVTTNTQTLEIAEGDTVHMSCIYVTDAENMQALDIEWLRVDALKPVVMYTDGEVFTPLEGSNSRYNFNGDYLNGDASITINSTQMADDGTYICKVKKHGDISSVEVTLTILVKPIPICSLEGGQPKINEDVKMKCIADTGTPEISYTWTRLIPKSPIENANVLGELWMKNVTLDDSGLYQCNASNRIGSNGCTVLLSVIPKEESAKSGSNVAGIVIGVLLLVAALGALGYFIFWYYTKKNNSTRNFPNDVRDDGSSPPTSRPPTRHTDRFHTTDFDDDDYRDEPPPSHSPPPPTNNPVLYTNVFPLIDKDGNKPPSERVDYVSIGKSDEDV
uniref:Ig-like domain-containing protein n=1 Tax=Eptatretus burgeri TaxID=7764 RepID=A0A8C4QBE3_EPTBU